MHCGALKLQKHLSDELEPNSTSSPSNHNRKVKFTNNLVMIISTIMSPN